jgi:hypothetical protein
MKSKSKFHSIIKQTIITFVILFLGFSFITKIQGFDHRGISNPYRNHKLIAPISWEDFFPAIPRILIQALCITIIVLIYLILGNKDSSKTDDTEQITL